MEVFMLIICYLFGVVVGGIFSIMLHSYLSEFQRFRDFEKELNVSEGQIIATMAAFWPLTVLAVVASVVGFFVHSVYVVFKNLFKMYKREDK